MFYLYYLLSGVIIPFTNLIWRKIVLCSGATPIYSFFNLNGEVGWLSSTQRRCLNMLRLWNQIIQLEKGIWDYNMQGVWC